MSRPVYAFHDDDVDKVLAFRRDSAARAGTTCGCEVDSSGAIVATPCGFHTCTLRPVLCWEVLVPEPPPQPEEETCEDSANTQ